jgi:hypothetical protein
MVLAVSFSFCAYIDVSDKKRAQDSYGKNRNNYHDQNPADLLLPSHDDRMVSS